MPQESAVAALFLHFKRVDEFKRQLKQWNTIKAGRALDLLTQAERDCKFSARPQQLICSRVFLQIAAQAAKK